MPSGRGDRYQGHMSILSECLELFAAVVTHGESFPRKNSFREATGPVSAYVSNPATRKLLLPKSSGPDIFLGSMSCLLSPEHSQVHPASPSSLPVPSAPSSGLLSSHRRFSHWLCVEACHSNQTICIYGDEGDHELLSPGNACVLVGAFWRELLEPDKAHTSFLSKLSLPCLQPLAPLLPNPTYM